MLEDAKPATEASETDDDRSGLSRRGALKCMVWAGTGILWTLSGGVPKSVGLIDRDLHVAIMNDFVQFIRELFQWVVPFRFPLKLTVWQQA